MKSVYSHMSTFWTLLLKRSTESWWTSLLLWIVTIASLSLLLRNFLFPWLIARLSPHIRIRSASLWSIRGLYIRTSTQILRVDRVSYGWSHGKGVNVRLDGLDIEVGRSKSESPAATARHRRRRLTLADFAPSPLAHRMLSHLYSLVEPHVRPLIRTFGVACLRLLIRWLPHIISNLNFDLRGISLTTPGLPGTLIFAEKISLHAKLCFTQLDKVIDTTSLNKVPRPPRLRGTYGMAAWKKRFTDSFRRTLDRAWGRAQGTVAITFRLRNIVGSTGLGLTVTGENNKFLRLPGTVNFQVSMGFNPREVTIDRDSLETTVDIADCFVKLDALHVLLKGFKKRQQQLPALDFPGHMAPTFLRPSFDASSLTPNTPNSEFLIPPVTPPQTESPPISALGSVDNLPSSLSLSPTSPFLEVLSASFLPHRRNIHRPQLRLKDVKDESVLSILRCVCIKISTITFSAAELGPGTGFYEAVVQDVKLGSSLSGNPPRNSLHRRWLGKGRKLDDFDSDSYDFDFSVQRVTVERFADLYSLRILTLGPINLQALATQWPEPWLGASPFMYGDPNTPFLALSIKIEALEITERIESLRQLFAHIESSPEKPRTQPRTLSSSLRLPRMAIEIHHGMMRGCIISDTSGTDSLVVELRNNGFVISASSCFETHNPAGTAADLYSGKMPLRMDYSIAAAFEPTLVKVRSRTTVDIHRYSYLRSPDQSFLHDPSIISTGLFEVHGEGHAIAILAHESENVASVISSSPILDLHFSTATFYIELWHPNAITVIGQLLSVIPIQETKAGLSPHLPLLDRMPAGISATLSFGRIGILATSPDINPQDNLALSRGFACNAALSIHYSALHFGHIHRFRDLLLRTQNRRKLNLPQEQVMDAISAARGSVITHNASAHFRISLSNISLRSAVTTRCDADIPSIFEGDDPTLDHEFLRLPEVKFNICLTGKRGSISSKSNDGCEISGVVSEIRATFMLAYVYDMLLALEGLKSLISVLPSRSTSRSPHRLVYRFKAVITTVQAMCVLPTQRVGIRMDGLDVHNSSDGFTVRLTKGLAWVPSPSRVNRWDIDNGNKWEELLCVQMLNVCFPSTHGTNTISVDGDSVRMRIPFGYVLADFLTDVTVTSKAIRHLSHATAAKKYTDMPAPEAEGPKEVPNLAVQIRCLSLEASDDNLESRLAVIWRCGLDAVKQRMEREAAFSAKVAAIYQSESQVLMSGLPDRGQNYQFSADHSISIGEARQRLNEVHELDWTLRLRNLRQKRSDSENAVNQYLYGKRAVKGASEIANMVEVTPTEPIPPLFRAFFNGLVLRVNPPSFPVGSLPDFLHKQGGGLPRDTQYSLLIPLHLNFTLSSVQFTLRDYPLPLFSIPPHQNSQRPTLEFDTELVIAEEMGSEASVDWIDCLILRQNHRVPGASSFSISVPKTIMPVKSYANSSVHVTSDNATIFSWGVSFAPAAQDLMRVIENLSSSSRDSSPGVGFWDKIRLLFHWRLSASFEGEVRFHMKGSRDPHKLSDDGAGFVLSWRENTKLLVGHRNDDGELIQITSDSMFIAIPNFEHLYPHNRRPFHARCIPESPNPFLKICAKLRSGVRFGVGFVLERSCGVECLKCFGSALHRTCRHFDFRPHYEVKLEKKTNVPVIKGPDDSYNRFRSDFIHLSISLVSSTTPGHSLHSTKPSSIHLTPKAFAHFWAWCDLFDSAFSLPTRQGSYYPSRTISPKLGRHIATLKYRVQIHSLYIMHAYIDESRETWVDGVIPWIGVKGMVDEFHVDMHQREEEIIIPGLLPDSAKVLRRKPFYAAEVALKGLDLRALLATFGEPLRGVVEMTAPSQRSNYRAHQNLPSTAPSSPWYDEDDFIEIDWSPSVGPGLHLLPVITCPHFAYFKRNSAALENATETSKFGSEQSHTCLIGKEPSTPQVQISLVSARIRKLRKMVQDNISFGGGHSIQASLERKIMQLEEHVTLLRESDDMPDGTGEMSSINSHISHCVISPDEWAEFEHVYQVHCPRIYMNNSIRDIILQYYYSSRARKGLEYRMATRAVKFIRDQAELVINVDSDLDDNSEATWDASTTAQGAASALKKMLKGDHSKPSVEVVNQRLLEEFDPLDGWSDGISLSKSHCCLLLKPQIVLQGEEPKDTLIVAAVQANLQMFDVMDESNADDPISGKVMSRSFTSVSGLQTFAPTALTTSEDISIPLELLIDLRCEDDGFDCLVPQTEATVQYDKFNRLRLRNNITSVTRTSTEGDNHLQDQTDLIRVHIPRFSVSASDMHFQAISNIVTRLILFSDAAHKTRLDKLETLLFTYDFTDLTSAANVVADLRDRLADAIESQRIAENNHSPRLEGEEGQLELLRLKAHIFLLSEELNFVFDAIKLAQDQFDDHTDQKSALLLHASSSEISWKMLDDRKDLLSKLVVQDIDFSWLSRQDSATSNKLLVGNLQAFDGSRSASWAEILSKLEEPETHPLKKRGLFLLSNWTVLAPVGGIAIYELFELSLHPMRLQIDARVGQRIMEYLWPTRRRPHEISDKPDEKMSPTPGKSAVQGRKSLDSPPILQNLQAAPYLDNDGLPVPLRKLGASRSFTDLRATMSDTLRLPTIHKVHSSELLRRTSISSDVEEERHKQFSKKTGDAAEMKNRASQKSFVLVRISSMHLLLSIVKEGSFECHNAHIRTRDLEYRNETWSFEELVNQFIPTDTSWKGWIRMAFHQPLLPVFPVARELLSKTKLIASSTRATTQPDAQPRLHTSKALMSENDPKFVLKPGKGLRKGLRWKPDVRPDEQESLDVESERSTHSTGRRRLRSLFNRTASTS